MSSATERFRKFSKERFVNGDGMKNAERGSNQPPFYSYASALVYKIGPVAIRGSDSGHYGKFQSLFFGGEGTELDDFAVSECEYVTGAAFEPVGLVF